MADAGRAGGFEDIDVGAVIEGFPDGVLISDVDGRIVYANPQAAGLCGYPASELAGMRIEDLVPLTVRSIHERHRAGYFEDPRVRRIGTGLELWLRHRNGTSVPVDIALSPLPGSGGRLAIAAVRDDRAPREAKRTVQEQAQLLEAAHDAFLTRRFEDSRITYWNQGAVRMYGHTRQQAMNVVSHDLLATHFPESLEAVDRTLVERGEWEGELRHTTRHGDEILVESRQVLLRDDRDRPATIFEVNRDVTEQRLDRDRLAGALDVIQAILGGEDDEAVLRRVAGHARRLVRASQAVAVVADVGGGPVAGSDPDRGEVRDPGRLLAERPLALAIDERKPRAIDGLPVRWGDLHVSGAAMVVPLVAADQSLGALLVVDEGRGAFARRHMDVLLPYAGAVGVALDYARLREELRRLAVFQDRERIARDLHDSLIKTLFGVALELQSVAMRVGDGRLRAQLETNMHRIDRAIADLRAYVFQLRLDRDREP